MKPRVGIDDVAFSLGYKLNRQAGVGRYIELILPDGRGEKLDTIIISHPQEKDRQRYFHRNSGKRGDVVDFIGENLGRFNKFGRNQWEVIGKVLADFANMPVVDNHDRGYSGGLGSLNPVFNPKRYTAQPLARNMDYAMGIFEDRGISRETVSLFERHIAIVTDQKNRNSLPMIGFPYREPDFNADLAGYELRGDRGFKGKAAGTNSTTAMWTAGIHSALNNPQMVRHVYFCESAYDAMSFYQANRAKMDLVFDKPLNYSGEKNLLVAITFEGENTCNVLDFNFFYNPDQTKKAMTYFNDRYTFDDYADTEDWPYVNDDCVPALEQPVTRFFYTNATGINDITTGSNTLVKSNDATYNLAGQRVGKSYKGIVISNGKKFVK